MFGVLSNVNETLTNSKDRSIVILPYPIFKDLFGLRNNFYGLDFLVFISN